MNNHWHVIQVWTPTGAIVGREVYPQYPTEAGARREVDLKTIPSDPTDYAAEQCSDAHGWAYEHRRWHLA